MSSYYTPSANRMSYDFVAHGSAVTCLALGQKSGRVMVTGGDDARINLWAVGKTNIIMSLNGPRTSIDCVKFNQTEDILGAGSGSGVIKLWDLEAVKPLQTLTGHKTNVRCLDFHPYGSFLASGSFDTSIKLWDYRKKGNILTYKAHSKDVHCLKLSPDGRWLASGGSEGTVMLYDIVAGKMLAELKGHTSSVTDVVFHPNEFLLASSSTDGTVRFWDLESFMQVSTTNYQSDVGPIRKIGFHPEGKALISGAKDIVKVYGWEPTRLYDSLVVSWGRLSDMAVLDDQLIAGSYSMATVSVYMVDITTLQPFNYLNSMKTTLYSRDSVLRQSTRRSFNHDQSNKTCKQLESLESDRTDELEMTGSDGDDSLAEIFNACDYKEIFQSRRELTRTPPCSSPVSSNADYNMRSLPDTSTIPQSLSLHSHLKTLEAANGHASEMIITPSVRHLSESMSNIHLANPGGVPSTAVTPKLAPLNHPHYPTNLSQAPSLSSLTPKPVEPACPQKTSTPSAMSSSSSSSLSSTSNHHHHHPSPSTAILTPLTQSGTPTKKPSVSVAANNNHNTTGLSKKITSVVRPMVKNTETITGVTPIAIANQNSRPPTTKSFVGNNQHLNQKTDKPGGILPLSGSVQPQETFNIVPDTRNHPAGLDINEFLPKHIQQYGYDCTPFLTEMEAIDTITKGHKATFAGLDYRRKQVNIVMAMWATKDARTALEYAVNLDEKSIIIDILNVINLKSNAWNLDVALTVLPTLQELLESKYESYITVACASLSIILKTFSTLIKNNISAPPGVGVDLSREERYNKCMKCYNHLLSLRAFVLKRQTLQGKIGRLFRELSLLMQNLD